MDTGHRVGETVVVASTDPQNKYLVTGCSAGFVKAWDISKFKGVKCNGVYECAQVGTHASVSLITNMSNRNESEDCTSTFEPKECSLLTHL